MYGNDRDYEKSYRGEKSTEKWEDNGVGGKVKVTYYKDGSATVDFGGMTGKRNYDKFGEER